MSVSHKSPPGRTHATTFIIANYYFGPNDVKKQGKVNIRSVTAVESSQLHEELKEILRQRELPINNIAASPPAANAPNIMAQQRLYNPICNGVSGNGNKAFIAVLEI